MIDPDVRLAAPGDADQLVGLEREARNHLVDQRGGARWLETNRELAWTQRIADQGAVVAHIGEVLVGYLAITTGGPVARIDAVYVTPEARQLGFGDAMIERAMALAREAGAVSIEGEALPGDRDTKNLYERAGVTARLIVLARRLDV